jgi:cytochrome c biogenesis protein CcmG, thiol:disulfide interchange protein DsbE
MTAPRRWRTAAPVLLVILFASLFALALRMLPRDVPSPLVNYPAPAAASLPLPVDALLGRVWVLNVWASWCAPCLEEHPLLMALAGSRHVTLVGLNHRDREDFARAWLARHGNPYDLLVADPEGSIGAAWGVRGVPQTFVVDAQGVVRFRQVGRLTPQVVEKYLVPLLRTLDP